MKCSIIIPFYSNPVLLNTAVSYAETSAAKCGDYEIIIVNDGSNHTSAVAPRNHCKQINLPQNGGYSFACNAGVAEAKGEYLFIMDADVFPEPKSIGTLIRFSESLQESAAVSAQVLRTSDHRVHHYGVSFFETDVLKPFRGRVSPAPALSGGFILQAITSDSMLIRRDIMNALNGFDRTFSNSYCDLDLSFRLREEGITTTVCTNAITSHRSRSAGLARTKGEEDQKCRFYKKWGSQVRNDFHSLIELSLKHFAPSFNDKIKPCVGFNIMRSLYSEQYQHQLSEIMNNTTSWIRVEPPSDSTTIRLEDVVPWSLITGGETLLFLVNSIDELSGNSFIAKNRARYRDLCVDMNGNVLLLSEVGISER